MNRLTQTAFVLLATSALFACGPRQEASENATDMQADAGGNMAAADPSNPFVDAEMRMNDKMMAALGSDVGQNWAVKMIEHHQGAVDMSRIVLEHNPTAEVAKMARGGIDKQAKDISSIKVLVKAGAPDQASAELYRPAMMDMHGQMMAAKGTDVSDTFLRKMLAHHEGAVAMSDVALKKGVTGPMRAQIVRTRAENAKDAAMVESMLGGKSTMAENGSSTVAAGDAKPTPTTVSSGMPVPGTNTVEHVVVNEDRPE